MDSRGLGSMKLDGIANEILKHLRQLNGIGGHFWQRLARDGRVAFGDGYFEIGNRRVEGLFATGQFESTAAQINARISQQILDQGLHPLGSISSKPNKLAFLSVELGFRL